jgi:hypothetical protein
MTANADSSRQIMVKLYELMPDCRFIELFQKIPRHFQSLPALSFALR